MWAKRSFLSKLSWSFYCRTFDNVHIFFSPSKSLLSVKKNSLLFFLVISKLKYEPFLMSIVLITAGCVTNFKISVLLMKIYGAAEMDRPHYGKSHVFNIHEVDIVPHFHEINFVDFTTTVRRACCSYSFTLFPFLFLSLSHSLSLSVSL